MKPYLSKIDSIEFFPLGDKKIEQICSVEIKSANTFNSEKIPITGGLCESRLGTIDYNYNCSTCLNTKSLCPGHNGYINIRIPFMSPMYVFQIIQFLKIICAECYKLVDPLASLGNTNFGGKKCKHCGAIQPYYAKPSPPIMIKVRKVGEEKYKMIYPHQIRHILDSVSDDTLKKLGVSLQSHPREYICNKLIIESIVARPDVKQVGGNSRSNNDKITVLYHFIVSQNNNELSHGLRGTPCPHASQDVPVSAMIVEPQEVTYQGRTWHPTPAPREIISRSPSR